jgi:hypothetical protein
MDPIDIRQQVIQALGSLTLQNIEAQATIAALQARIPADAPSSETEDGLADAT